MKNCIIIILFINFALSLALYSSDLPTNFREKRIDKGLNPVSLIFAPDGKLLVCEKNGIIKAYKNDTLLPKPFAILQVDNFNERGLFSIAFDPEYNDSNYVYIFYSSVFNKNLVSRFKVVGDTVDLTSEKIIFESEHFDDRSVHNGGSILFGLDGKLYVSTGDQAYSYISQEPTSLQGKILRFNKDGSIPSDNPFFNSTITGIKKEIYASGLRNPFKLKLNSNTGQIFVTDVGSWIFEEINELKPGANYGWPILEGVGQQSDEFTNPVFAYGRDMGCAITASTFYDPANSNFPQEYYNGFFFSDYCNGYIKFFNPITQNVEEFARYIDRPVDMIVNPLTGNLYYLARGGMGGGSVEDNSFSPNGELYRIEYDTTGEAFIGKQPDNILVFQGQQLQLYTKAFGRDIRFQWFMNGIPIPEASGNILTIDNIDTTFNNATFKLHVFNDFSLVESRTIVIKVLVNNKPSPTIEIPTEGTLYSGGSVISFSGIAFDIEDGWLDEKSLSWKLDFHHDDHTHPAMEVINGVRSGTFNIPTTGETSSNVWYRLYFSAKDSHNGVSTIFRDIYPQKVNINLKTIPENIPVYLDGLKVNTPYNFTNVTGIQRIISVEESIDLSGKQYLFEKWSMTDDRIVLLNPNESDTLLIAYFKEIKEEEPIIIENNQLIVQTISNDGTFFTAGLKNDKAANISIYNSLGNKMELYKEDEKIIIKNCVPGLYILKVETTNNIKEYKLVAY